MSKGSARAVPCPGCYQLPEEAYSALQQTRDRLRLLACLAAPRSWRDDLPGAELPLKAVALAQCFEELADRIDGSLAAASWPEECPPAE